jgi:hypothetical protein
LKHHFHFLIPTQSPETAAVFALAFAFLAVIPQGSASSFASSQKLKSQARRNPKVTFLSLSASNLHWSKNIA